MAKSMNSGTSASVALPERSSFGITRSARRRTVDHSWAVKNFGAKAVPFFAAAAAALAFSWAAERLPWGRGRGPPRAPCRAS